MSPTGKSAAIWTCSMIALTSVTCATRSVTAVELLVYDVGGAPDVFRLPISPIDRRIFEKLRAEVLGCGSELHFKRSVDAEIFLGSLRAPLVGVGNGQPDSP